jgi:hypothetical protein
MPRRAQHAGDDVEQPLSPANVKRQTRLVPLGAAAHASPLMRQASMAHHAHGGGAAAAAAAAAPPWFAAATGAPLRAPTMPAPRRGPSDWSRELAPQSTVRTPPAPSASRAREPRRAFAAPTSTAASSNAASTCSAAWSTEWIWPWAWGVGLSGYGHGHRGCCGCCSPPHAHGQQQGAQHAGATPRAQ